MNSVTFVSSKFGEFKPAHNMGFQRAYHYIIDRLTVDLEGIMQNITLYPMVYGTSYCARRQPKNLLHPKIFLAIYTSGNAVRFHIGK